MLHVGAAKGMRQTERRCQPLHRDAVGEDQLPARPEQPARLLQEALRYFYGEVP